MEIMMGIYPPTASSLDLIGGNSNNNIFSVANDTKSTEYANIENGSDIDFVSKLQASLSASNLDSMAIAFRDENHDIAVGQAEDMDDALVSGIDKFEDSDVSGGMSEEASNNQTKLSNFSGTTDKTISSPVQLESDKPKNNNLTTKSMNLMDAARQRKSSGPELVILVSDDADEHPQATKESATTASKRIARAIYQAKSGTELMATLAENPNSIQCSKAYTRLMSALHSAGEYKYPGENRKTYGALSQKEKRLFIDKVKSCSPSNFSQFNALKLEAIIPADRKYVSYKSINRICWCRDSYVPFCSGPSKTDCPFAAQPNTLDRRCQCSNLHHCYGCSDCSGSGRRRGR
jgi:hypothetical protein